MQALTSSLTDKTPLELVSSLVCGCVGFPPHEEDAPRASQSCPDAALPLRLHAVWYWGWEQRAPLQQEPHNHSCCTSWSLSTVQQLGSREKCIYPEQDSGALRSTSPLLGSHRYHQRHRAGIQQPWFFVKLHRSLLLL